MGIAGGVKNLPWLFTATFITLLVAQPLSGYLGSEFSGYPVKFFGATLPANRGRGMQTALLARRIHEAAVLGCRWVHTETAAHTRAAHNPSLSNMLRTGFDNPYDKVWWAPTA